MSKITLSCLLAFLMLLYACSQKVEIDYDLLADKIVDRLQNAPSEELEEFEQETPLTKDFISSVISQGTFSGRTFSDPEIKMLEALRFSWKFDRTGKEIRLPEDTKKRFPVNGNFETKLEGWTKWVWVDRLNSQRSCEVLYDEEKESNVVEFKRTGGGADGSFVGIVQDVYIDLSKYDQFYLQLEAKSMYQTVPYGGAWAGGSEYPVCIELAFIDQNGTPHRWQHGFYYRGQDKYPTSTKVAQNAWFTYTSPNLKEIIPLCGCSENVRDMKNWFGVEMHPYNPPVMPKVITRVMLFGGGWDFIGRADNLQFRTSLKN